MPRIVAHFELQALLGHGTLGELHRARDLEVGRTAALRLIAPSIAADPRALSEVLEAAHRVAACEHPSIAAVYAAGDSPDGPFIASEFVPGQPLSAMVHGTPLNPKRALDLAAQIADGLAAAQEQGLTHGALTAVSVIVTPKGIAKVLDAGLVAWTAGAGARRDDTYAIGALLFEMLVGRPLKAGWPSELRVPELPIEVRPVLQRLVAPRQGEAFESMATVAAVLRDLGLVVAARTAASASEAAPADPERRGFGTAAAVGLVVLLVLAVLAWALVRGRLT